ncbi:putative metalloprotease CJM1_0395 family protein [Colwellia sp. E2M01]|uniref:putative metalloprotease CJM1_0395 family protein n=1 Tax=Colwellia sp. E2M01 TaxID=2841561 RepID=UPI001C098B65|nr:putative metalloprotease CJM1_0395 family protein [Colwellia sp. E2M01]MBU2869537.1 hypothetical protein [Colwellia sp. E2M01]
MNITSHTASIPLATVVNQPTEVLRRDNHQREVNPQVAATHPSTADKGAASEKERSRTPAQTNENIDFSALRKQAEHAATSISDNSSQQGESQQDNQQNSQQNPESSGNEQSHNAAEKNSDEIEKKEATENKEAATNERIINQLQLRDQEVKTHELAHATTGGALTGAPSYTYEVGPDGKKYAVAGEVSIDLSVVPGDPKATITKMQKVYAAALAPVDPSAQDIKVAASATQKILSAQSELLALSNNKDGEPSRASNNRDFNTSARLQSELSADNSSNDFDALINKTLAAQEAISPNKTSDSMTTSINNLQSTEVIQRAHRIENFYHTVKQGYEKPNNFQFELTA